MIKGNKKRRKEGNVHWSKTHNKEHHIIYFATDVITDIKSNRRAWTVHASCMGEIKITLKALVENSKRKDNLRRRRFVRV